MHASGRIRHLATPAATILMLLLVAGPRLAAAGSPAANPTPRSAMVTNDVAARAAALERAGQTLPATRLYEQLTRTDPARRKVLGPHLVQLYAKLGDSDHALAWAHEVMADNPDPQAYLAGVYSLLGQPAEATALLSTELAKTNTAQRAVTLRWQLADTQLQQGHTNAALTTLRSAVETAKGSPLERPAKQRLERVSHGGAFGDRAPPADHAPSGRAGPAAREPVERPDAPSPGTDSSPQR